MHTKKEFQMFTVIDFRTPLSRNALCRSALQQMSSIIWQCLSSSQTNKSLSNSNYIQNKCSHDIELCDNSSWFL